MGIAIQKMNRQQVVAQEIAIMEMIAGKGIDNIIMFCLKSIKSHNFKAFFYVVFLSIVLTSCGEEPFPRCIDADDFGNIKFSLSANRQYGHNDFKFENGDRTDEQNANQVIRWRKTGYTTTGEDLIVRTTGEWTSWLSDKNRKLSASTKVLDKLDDEEGFDEAMNLSSVNKDRKCNPYTKRDLGFGANAFDFDGNQSDTQSSGQYGAPCWFINGWGLNILFKRPGDPDPNSSAEIARHPHSPTVHAYYLGYGEPDALNAGLPIGEYKTGHAFGIDGNSGVFGKIKIERGWDVYTRITDKYYYDNAGGYIISFIKGVSRPPVRAVFETIRQDIDTTLSRAVQQIYANIVSNRQFRQLTLMMIAIFIAANGYLYILGLKEYKQGELVMIMLKLLFIGFLLQPNSWLFFNEFIFSFIRDLINFMIATVNSNSIAIDYNPDKPFLFLDEIIVNKLFSGVVWNGKIFAVLINNIFGVVAAFMIILILLVYLILVMYGFVLYMLGYFIISLLFCLFPIFFVFGLLVPQCRELLTNWLTQIFSYFLQMVFYFALLGLISAAIMNSYYRIMGFTICYNKWLSIDFTIWSKDYSNFTAGTYFTAHKIPVPADQEKAICVSECKDECENGANIDACK
ncbi:MAG: type IV secretion system protein, partial [Candidatus Heimdallarchaeota archaeon]|nr:type IV secretion system protein [Candidatus Heimdallarchaeota archaeon]